MRDRATWLLRGGSILSFLSCTFLLKSIRVPLLELCNELRLLIIDRLLSELSLLLKFFEFLVRLSVLLFEFFKLSKSLQLLLVNNFCLLPVIKVFESISLRCESGMHRLSHCVALLLFVFPIKEALDVINLTLNRIYRLSL